MWQLSCWTALSAKFTLNLQIACVMITYNHCVCKFSFIFEYWRVNCWNNVETSGQKRNFCTHWSGTTVLLEKSFLLFVLLVKMHGFYSRQLKHFCIVWFKKQVGHTKCAVQKHWCKYIHRIPLERFVVYQDKWYSQHINSATKVHKYANSKERRKNTHILKIIAMIWRKVTQMGLRKKNSREVTYKAFHLNRDGGLVDFDK